LLDACIEYDRCHGDVQRESDTVERSETIPQLLARYAMPTFSATRRFNLDWPSLTDLYARMGADERDVLGIHVSFADLEVVCDNKHNT
jgi:hypothetical protein